jgi:predicted DNA binding protein
MHNDKFILLTFIAKHNCWSNITKDIDKSNLYVRILTSYPVTGKQELFTAISVYGMKDFVGDFILKLRNANNVNKIISISPLYDIHSSITDNLLIQFVVDSKDTITNIVSASKPISFTVKIFNGVEYWNVYFWNPMKYQVSHLMKILKSKFDIMEYSIIDAYKGYLYEAPNKFFMTEAEINFINILLRNGFFDSPRTRKLKDLSKEIGLSPSSLSRKSRELERRILERIIENESI